jgi:NADH-quinone oxidoreductase subunit J
MWGIDVFGIVFIIIYVGAIAVLFLFVIMMLDVKAPIGKSILNSQLNGIFRLSDIWYLGFLLLFLFSFDAQLNQDAIPVQDLGISSRFYSQLDSFSYVEVLGQTLYNDMLYCFLIAGILLVVALVGAVVLTLKSKSLAGAQNVNRQLSRRDNFSSFFK